MKLRILTLGIAVSVLTACGGGDKQDDAKVLNVYNYSDYIAEDTIPNFEKATGTKVTYDVFDSDEMVETKLLAGNSGYDVVVPTLNFFGRQIKAGVFLPLDKSRIPNLANLDPSVMKRIAQQDPGNEYGVPYMIGTTGIGYNVELLKQRFGGSTEIANSWDLIFKPENIAKMKDCGITIPGYAVGHDPDRAALPGRGSAQPGSGHAGEGRRAAQDHPPVRAELPLLAVRGLAGQRRYLPGRGLVR